MNLDKKVKRLKTAKVQMEFVILASLFYQPKDIVDLAHALDESMFDHPTFRRMYKYLKDEYLRTGEIKRLSVFKEAIDLFDRRGDLMGYAKEATYLLFTYDLLVKLIDEFEHGLDRIMDVVNDFEKSGVVYDTITRLVEQIETAKKHYIALEDNYKLFMESKIYNIMRIAKEFIQWRTSGSEIVIPSGYAEIDDYIQGGFVKGDLVLLGARPRMGKTSFACQIASNVAENFSVNFYSLEMDRLQILRKIVAFRQGKDPAFLDRFTKDEDILSAVEGLKLNIIDDLFELKEIEKDIIKTKPDFVVIDYIQLLKTGWEKHKHISRDRELTLAIEELKRIAKRHEVAMLVLSQLKRRVEESREVYPHLTDLRESGGLENTADIVILLNRPELIGLTHDELGQPTKDNVYISIAKNRRGRENYFVYKFEKSFIVKPSEISESGNNLPF